MSLANKIRGLAEIWKFDNRIYLGLTRLLFRGENINIYRYKGLEILTDHASGDANGAREVFTSDMYRKYLPTLGLDGEINVLDIGANNGGFSLLLQSEGVAFRKLVCIEMNPETFSRLRFNIDRNLECATDVINAAVCGSEGKIEMNLGSGSAGDSIYSKKTSGQIRTIAGVTFDHIYQESFGDEIVDLCKIDIEGAEFEVFAGSRASQIQRCRNVLIEIHHDKDHDRNILRSRLSSLGFAERDADEKNDDKHHVHLFVNSNFPANNP